MYQFRFPEGLDTIGDNLKETKPNMFTTVPRLLEKVYEVCVAHELRKAGYDVKWQLDIPIIYDGIQFNEGLRLDLLVNDLVIAELKAIELINPV